MKKQYLTLLFYFLSLTLSAQIKLTGVVTDETGTPLPGVTVVEKEAKTTHFNGTMTDIKGKFNRHRNLT